MVACTNCPAGSYGTQQGQISKSACQNCEMGRASYLIGSSNVAFCESCLKGTYAPIPGLSACKICPRGYVTNVTGSTKCTACVPGKFNADDQKFRLNHHNCDHCGSTGLPKSGIAAWFCEACPSGWESSSNPTNPCDVCTAGRFQNHTVCTGTLHLYFFVEFFGIFDF